jgi:hypothetical protein
MRTGPLPILMVLGFAATPCQQGEAASPEPSGLRPVSSLPPLKRVWSVSDVELEPAVGELAQSSVLLGRGRGEGGKAVIVAVETKTGKVLWRSLMPSGWGRRQLMMVGNHALAHGHDGEMAAFDGTNGKPLWARSTGCGLFVGGLQAGPAGIALGMCMQAGGDYGDRKMSVLALDLGTGRELWRLAVPQRLASLSVAGDTAYVVWVEVSSAAPPVSTIQWVDVRTGKQGQRFQHPGMALAAFLYGDRIISLGSRMTALRAKDGELLWSLDLDEHLPDGIRTSHTGLVGQPAIFKDRLLHPWSDRIAQIDLATGKEVGSFPLPVPGQPGAPPSVVSSLGERTLVVVSTDLRKPGYLLLIEADGRSSLRAAPVPATDFVAAHGGILVAYGSGPKPRSVLEQGIQPGRLDGYSLPDVVAMEPVVQSPRARVQTLLERKGRHLDDSAIAELRGIVGYQEQLVALVKDPTSKVRSEAIAGAVALGLPGLAQILLAVLDEPMPSRPEYKGLRGEAALALAKLDDPTVARRLSPILLDEKQAWLLAAHISTVVVVRGAVYRLLARVGGREELAVLEQYDRTRPVSTGWLGVCAASDEAAAKGDETPHYAAIVGLCQGEDVGQFRRVRQPFTLWLRQKLPKGGLGPPALVVETDPGKTFHDSDGDGLPDSTETMLGTDPKRTDTDGDGLRDGEDSSPTAAPAKTESARAQVEAIRYVMQFIGNETGWSNLPVVATVRGDLKSAAQIPGGLYLHWPATKPSEPRRPPIGALLEVGDAQVNGDTARVEVAWARGSRGNMHVLSLRKLGGTWRVIDAETTREWIE